MKSKPRKFQKHVRFARGRNVVSIKSQWSHREFGLQLPKAGRVGANRMPHDKLVRLCHDGLRHFRRQHLSRLGPLLVELSQRVERHEIPDIHTKTGLCAAIGCSLRWLEVVVSGEKQRAARGTSGTPQTPSQAFDLPSDEEFVSEIAAYAMSKLKPLMRLGAWDRYRHICELVSKSFADARKIERPNDSATEGTKAVE